MTAPRDDEPERDAWLREALRHAPDADTAPPTSISERILRNAHDAVRPAPAAAPANPLLQLWSWLARPPVAAGFASVMVATVVGVMWWDKPLDEALPRPAPSIAAAPPASEARVAEVGSVPEPAAPAPAQGVVQGEVQDRAAPAAKQSAPRAARAERSSSRDALADAKRERAAEPPARAAESESRKRNADLAPSAAVTAPAPAPAAVASPAAVPAAVPAAAAPAPVAATESAANAARPAAQGFAKSAPAPAPTMMLQRRQDDALRTPAIDDAARWTWQRAGNAAQPMRPALQHWLAQLDQAANWRSTRAPPPPASAGHSLRLWRDGELRAVIQVQDDAAWLVLPGSVTAISPLTAAEVATLRAALIDAAP